VGGDDEVESNQTLIRGPLLSTIVIVAVSIMEIEDVCDHVCVGRNLLKEYVSVSEGVDNNIVRVLAIQDDVSVNEKESDRVKVKEDDGNMEREMCCIVTLVVNENEIE
jgi:uncharacterized protein involved in tellurium resistance